MSRSLTIRTGIAALAFLPALSACTITTTTSKTGESPTTVATAQQTSGTESTSEATEQASNEAGAAKSSETETSESTESGDTESGSTESGTSESGTTEAGTSDGTTTTQSVEVPAGSGLERLDVIDIHGAPTSTGDMGRITAAYKAVTDRPLMLNLRVKLFDENGKQLAENTGLTSIYTVGAQYLVTTNLIELPAGKKVHSFKASLIEVTPLDESFTITKMPMPTLGKSSESKGLQVLKGTVTTTGSMNDTVDAEGVCIMPDGTMYHGTDTLNDNKANGNVIAYEIPLYDADGVDLSQAKCYTSA